MSVIRVDDCATRETIEAAIKLLCLKRNRMPAHWDDRRGEIAAEIDALVDRWILLGRSA